MDAPSYPVPPGAAGPYPGYPGPPLPVAAPAYRRASVVDRAIAVLLDSVLLAIVSFVLLLPFGLLFAFGRLAGLGLTGLLFAPALLLSLGLAVVYFTYFEGLRGGQTIGKRLLGIRVVDRTTLGPVPLRAAFVRNVLRIVDWLPTLYLLGFLVIELSPHHQRLGDLVGDTLVIRA